MDVLVPFAADEPKTRLDPVLGPDERAAFARAMLLDVCDALEATGREPTVLATAAVEVPYPVTVDERPLTEAVDAHVDPPAAVVMADLALSTPAALERLFEADGDVVLAPGLGGGTNAAVVRHDGFTFDYHGVSVRDHRRRAEAVDADLAMVDSFRLAVDVDEAGDLVEVLLHGEGRARRWLLDAGFGLETTDGRAAVGR
ncbi:2-phospho-L-lactate guanylyltransferase [Halobacteriales archaeon QS_9_68_42]|nr:MAG: 2-phospho-L-lactate guanylyltransferase [Halobacteriales archaeon QS_9_68_42]